MITDAAAPIIRIESLVKRYDGADFNAVDGLDMTIAPGEIFGLLGPNGAGKTTTAGMLTTRVVPTSGRVFIGDIDVVAQPALAKQLIGVVSQSNTLDRQLTVWENLYFHGLLFGIPTAASKRLATEMLEQFKLDKWAAASVYALSGGMAQRLMVARSIMHRPAVLFLDEPTAGLDPQSRIALWEILSDLHAAGQTIMLTTHYMEEADHLCDRVAIVDHGRMLALDTPEGLKRSVDADSIVTLRAEGDLEAFAARVEQDLDGTRRVRRLADGLEIHVSHSGRILPRIIALAEAAAVDVVDVSVAEPTLETVFIDLTGKELRDE